LKGIVDFLLNDDGSHRDGTACETFGTGDHIRNYIKILRSKRCSQPTEPSDYFIKNKYYIMFITYFTNSF